jgi:GntR family transcriptional repressor for pyruvate dehydrogenase complex
VKDDSLPFALDPIRKIDVFRSVLGQLQELVSRMEPGMRLGSERELAERLNVSRVSIREALRALESMGKVEIRRNAGTFITERPLGQPRILDRPAEVDAEYIQHLSEVREALECAIIRAVIANPHKDMRQVHAALETAGKQISADKRPQGSLDLRFETALASICGNPVLAGMQRITHEMWIDAWVRLGGAVADAPRLHNEHQRILAALEDGDADAAQQLMAEHVNPVSRRYPASILPGRLQP